MNCAWSNWGKFSECNKSCGSGDGSQERTRTIVTASQNGGKACDGSNKDTRNCNNGGCPGMKSKVIKVLALMLYLSL